MRQPKECIICLVPLKFSYLIDAAYGSHSDEVHPQKIVIQDHVDWFDVPRTTRGQNYRAFVQRSIVKQECRCYYFVMGFVDFNWILGDAV